ncbi:hypothetical protein TWF730_004506 [Orbilia blumenaviensis]|uniref:LysM domain-containing protein n=1 Tax=Orbilia blumenaviensis TaxID=1796055 RepID=A0AAV9TY98_9PEZI
MRGTLLFIGIQCLLAGVSLATVVKECRANEKEGIMKASCISKLQQDTDGFITCSAVCSRPDKNKSYVPGDPSNQFSADNAPAITPEDYEEFLKECGSHGAIVEALVETCACHADGFWGMQKCDIKLDEPIKATGSVTSTASPDQAETTKNDKDEKPVETNTEDNNQTVEATSTQESQAYTNSAEDGMPTSTVSSFMEGETGSPELSNSSGPADKTRLDEETSTDASLMPSITQGYDTEVSATSDPEPEATTGQVTATEEETMATSATEEETMATSATKEENRHRATYVTEEETMATSVTEEETMATSATEEETMVTSATEEETMATSIAGGVSETPSMYPSASASGRYETGDMDSTTEQDASTPTMSENHYGQVSSTEMEPTMTETFSEETTMPVSEAEETSTEDMAYGTPSHTKIPHTKKASTTEPATTSMLEYLEEPSSEDQMSQSMTATTEEYTETQVYEPPTETPHEITIPTFEGYVVEPTSSIEGYVTETAPSMESYAPEVTSSTDEYYPAQTISEAMTTTTPPMGYSSMDEHSETQPTATMTEESSMSSPQGYTPMDEYSETQPTATMTEESSMSSPQGYTPMDEYSETQPTATMTEESTMSSPERYTSMAESSQPLTEYGTMEESSQPPMGYNTMEESSSSPISYSAGTMAETTASMVYETAPPATTATSESGYPPPSITWTIDRCPQPTNANYESSTIDFGCLGTVDVANIEALCDAASKSGERGRKWGELPDVTLQAYTEAYNACGEALPWALKTVCGCIDLEQPYSGPVPTDTPSNFIPGAYASSHSTSIDSPSQTYVQPTATEYSSMPLTLPATCTPKPCIDVKRSWPDNCLKAAESWDQKAQEEMCSLLCNKEDIATLDESENASYQFYLGMCGLSHASLVDALMENCGCVLKQATDRGETCIYPRADQSGNEPGPVDYGTPETSTTSTDYSVSEMSTPPAYTSAPTENTVPQAYVSTTSAPTPMKTFPVKECPQEYLGQGKWPSGNCLDKLFGTEEGMRVAAVLCNYQCADNQQREWPAEHTEVYQKAFAKCKSNSGISQALAKGCGCLNDGWIGSCRPECHPPPGYTMETSAAPKTSDPYKETSAPPMENTSKTISWTTTTYVTEPCGGCDPTTVTTTVPCPTTTSSDMKGTIMATTTQMVITSMPTSEPTISTPLTVSSWSTVTYVTTKCEGCPATTLTTTVPCPSTLQTVKINPENGNTCTTANQVPQCTVPPGTPEGKGHNSRCNQWHLVQKGDTCYEISQRLSLDLKLLAQWNGMKSPEECTCTIGLWLCVALLDNASSEVPPPQSYNYDPVRFVTGRPTYSDYGPEASDYDNLPTPSPRPYLTEPIPPPETTTAIVPVAYL